MARNGFFPTSAALVVAIACVGNAAAESIVLKSGRLWLEGDSTLHVFSSTATQIDFSGDTGVPGALPEVVAKNGGITIEAAIPVRSLKSGEKGLDKNMYAALKAEKFPRITFRLSKYELAPDASSGPVRTLRAQGALSISGTEKPIELEISLQETPDGLRARGRKTLKMTDFGVKPPSLLLGAIKVRDPIVVVFDLLLALGKAAPSQER